MAGILTLAAGPVPDTECRDKTWVCLREEFLGGSLTSTTMGELGWTYANGSATAVTSEANHIGIINRSTGASSGTTAYTSLGGVTQGLLPMGTSKLWWIFRLNSNDANTSVRCGMLDGLSVSPGAGQYLEKQDADTNWFAVVEHGNVQTRIDMGVAIDTSWHTLLIDRIGNTAVNFYLDGILRATHTTGITTTACYINCQIINSAAAAKTIDLDYAEFRMPVTR